MTAITEFGYRAPAMAKNGFDWAALRARLPRDGAAQRALARASGVSFYTLRKLVSGETDNPRVRTAEALERAMRAGR